MASITWSFSTTASDTWNQGNDGRSYTLTSGSSLPANAVVSSVSCSITLHASYWAGDKVWRVYYIDVSNGPYYGSNSSTPSYTQGMSSIDTTISGLSMSGSTYSAFSSTSITVAAKANNNRDDSKTWIRGISVTVNYTTPSTVDSSVALNKTTATVGDVITASITRHSSSNYHTVVWTFGGSVLQTHYNVGTSDTYTVPQSLMSSMPSSTSGTITCTITTYNSAGSNIGSNSANATITVPTSYVPTISLSVSYNGTKTISGTAYKLVAYTNPVVTVTIAAGYGSSITDCTVSCTGLASQSRTSTGSVTFATFTTSGTNTISATVVDARGRSASTSTTVNVYSYNRPSMSYSCMRCNSGGTADPSGTYAKVTVSCTAGTLVGTGLSTVTVPISSVTVKSKTISASTYGNPSGTVNLSQGYLVLGTYSTSDQYNIQITLTDSMGTVVGVDGLYVHSNKVVDFYHSSSKDLVGFGADVQSGQSNYSSGVVIGSDWKIYNSNGLIVGVGTSNSYMIIYSSTQPTGVAVGQIWIKPV